VPLADRVGYFATQMMNIGASRAAASGKRDHDGTMTGISDELDGRVCGTCDN
jgi:hypothetical protein